MMLYVEANNSLYSHNDTSVFPVLLGHFWANFLLKSEEMLLELPPDASVADAYIAVAAERSLPMYQIKLIVLWTRMCTDGYRWRKRWAMVSRTFEII